MKLNCVICRNEVKSPKMFLKCICRKHNKYPKGLQATFQNGLKGVRAKGSQHVQW